jgi:phosphate starvation-inducible PhoH-like protein
VATARVTRSEVIETGDAEGNHRVTLQVASAETLRELVGELGQNLKVVGRDLNVVVQQRGNILSIVGDAAAVSQAATLFEHLEALAATGYHLLPRDVEQAQRVRAAHPSVNLVDLFTDHIRIGVAKKKVHPRSVQQRVYLQAIRERDLVFGVGPAGTGKTYLAVAMALGFLFRNEVQRIILCRPAVEAGEKLGFLPGDMLEKVDPYLRPMYDALNDLVDADRAARLLEKGVIEVAPLAFMRGRTLADAFVILDEAQNTTIEQMKMFLTRIGEGSRAVVTGDITQVDLPSGRRSGLIHALGVLSNIDDIAMVHFSDVDVVRHRLVAQIIRAYRVAEDRT